MNVLKPCLLRDTEIARKKLAIGEQSILVKGT